MSLTHVLPRRIEQEPYFPIRSWADRLSFRALRSEISARKRSRRFTSLLGQIETHFPGIPHIELMPPLDPCSEEVNMFDGTSVVLIPDEKSGYLFTVQDGDAGLITEFDRSNVDSTTLSMVNSRLTKLIN